MLYLWIELNKQIKFADSDGRNYGAVLDCDAMAAINRGNWDFDK
jgi:hypothetical protein